MVKDEWRVSDVQYQEMEDGLCRVQCDMACSRVTQYSCVSCKRGTMKARLLVQVRVTCQRDSSVVRMFVDLSKSWYIIHQFLRLSLPYTMAESTKANPMFI
jgi:hypothetical protein